MGNINRVSKIPEYRLFVAQPVSNEVGEFARFLIENTPFPEKAKTEASVLVYRDSATAPSRALSA